MTPSTSTEGPARPRASRRARNDSRHLAEEPYSGAPPPLNGAHSSRVAHSGHVRNSPLYRTTVKAVLTLKAHEFDTGRGRPSGRGFRVRKPALDRTFRPCAERVQGPVTVGFTVSSHRPAETILACEITSGEATALRGRHATEGCSPTVRRSACPWRDRRRTTIGFGPRGNPPPHSRGANVTGVQSLTCSARCEQPSIARADLDVLDLGRSLARQPVPVQPTARLVERVGRRIVREALKPDG